MARTYLAVKTQTNEVLGTLPLIVDGDLSSVMGNYSSGSFILPIDASTPSNWEELIEPELMSIWVIDSMFKEPLWGGKIVDLPRTSADEVSINCITFEGGLTTRFMRDSVYNSMDPMTTFRKIIEDHVEVYDSDSAHPELGQWFTGIGLEFDIQPSGLTRSIDFKEYNDTSVFEALESWATSNNFEWTIQLKFANPVTRTGLRKVVKARYKTLGTVTDHPNHEFLMSGMQSKKRSGDKGGNIASFSYSQATNGGAYATHVIAIGDGSGDNRTRSRPVKNSAREAQGYPRVEAKTNFAGVTFTEDAQTLGEEEAKRIFSHHDIITLEAHDNGATNLQSMELGDSVRVTIRTRSLPVRKVLRLVGWSVGNDSQSFSPTLAELGADPHKFKAAVDPYAVVPEKDTYGTNPNETGVYVPKPDGSGAWGIDPENGFGSWDSDGGFDGGDFGGGSSGTITRFKVKSYNAIAKTAVLVDRDGTGDEEYPAVNSSGDHLNPGDYVATGVDTDEFDDDETHYVVLANENVRFDDPVTYTKWRVHDKYPINVAPYGVALGSTFVDQGNAFQKGVDCAFVTQNSAYGGYNFYNRVTGQAGPMTPPAGYSEIKYGTYVWGGKGFKAFEDQNGQARMFKHNPTVVGGWQLLPGLPTTANAFNVGGDWTANSSSDEVFARPTIVTGRIANGKFQNWPQPFSNLLGIAVEFAVFQVSSSTNSMVPVHTFQALIPASSRYSQPGESVPAGIRFDISTYSNGNHIYIDAFLRGAVGGGTGRSETRLFYADLGSPDMTLHDLRTVSEYLGEDLPIRVSSDGCAYGAFGRSSGFANEALLTYRAPTDSEATTVVLGNYFIRTYSSTDWRDIQAQRDRLTSRFYVAGAVQDSSDDGATQETLVWEVYSTNSSVGTPLAPEYGGSATAVSRPQQMPDGSIMFNLRRDYERHELHLVHPDDGIWPELVDPEEML